ncbi:MAG: hypothetical protein M2R45_01589 [Verrucomicrobia subdivision 3 bacterium]|nr:hypothetical protein [Limisphaerales bacterium]
MEDKNERKGELFFRYFPKTDRTMVEWPTIFIDCKFTILGSEITSPEPPVLIRAEALSLLIRLMKPLQSALGS